MSIRPPAVADQFYPRNPTRLRNMIDTFLHDIDIDITAPKAIIAPHAGYVYSGPIAATAYASLIPVKDQIKRVVLLGPAHRVYLKGLALSSATHFATPLGNIPIEREACLQLQKLDQVSIMDDAHAQEHSLEVHLPFLQSVLADFSLIPLVVGDATPNDVAEVLETVWGDSETLIVISSDLSHYHDYETARRLDTATSNSIQSLDLNAIGSEQACGCMPVRGLLYIAKQKNMQVKTLDLRNSGDTAGTRDRVVGYGAYTISFIDPDRPSNSAGKLLFNTARRSIQSGLDKCDPYQPVLSDFPSELQQVRAVFVTLKIDEMLRGCIGTTEPVSPLIIAVADNAFSAAFKDPRFPSLTIEEFDNIQISISILTPKEAIQFSSETDLLKQLRPGTDGLIIESEGRRATFLPSVWESLPQANQFLHHLKLKAHIDVNQSPQKAWRYGADYYEESDYL
jgi:AmmeMemoRadiSam system protein B/AmmeMemoRadiSam system protein A